MTVAFAHTNADNTLDKKFGCPPTGSSIFPSIEFSGVPAQATHIHLEIIDATCSYSCNACCQFKHCALEFPLTALKDKEVFNFNGIKETLNPNVILKKYLLKNGKGKREYFPLCPPPFQTHAYYIRMTAYALGNDGKKIVVAKAQSAPVLFWSKKEVKSFKNSIDLTPKEKEKKMSPKKSQSDNGKAKKELKPPATGPIDPNKPAKRGGHLIKPIKKNKKEKSNSKSNDKPTTFKQNSWK